MYSQGPPRLKPQVLAPRPGQDRTRAMWMTLHLSILLFPHYQRFKPLFVPILFTRVKKHPQILCLPSFFAHGQNLFWHASRTGKLLDLLKNTITAENARKSTILKTELMLIFMLFSWPAVGLLPLIYQTIS